MSNELVVRKENLPATIEELKKFIIITKKRIEAHKVQIDAIKRLGLSKSVYDQKLEETQFMSETVLYAEAKMGRLLSNIPKAKGTGGGRYSKSQLTNTGVSKLKTELQRTGISMIERSRAETLGKNKEVIKEVVEEETNRGNLPTREKVLRRVRENKVIKYREALKKRAKTYEKELPPVVHSDFYKYCMKNIKPDSIDHIITDPPYPEKYLPLWSELSEVADRVLKPGGLCIAYSGEYHLPEVIDRMREHLHWYWIVCMKMSGAHNLIMQRKIYKGFRTIVIFYKKPLKQQKFSVSDFIEDKGGRAKELHPWQQSLYGFAQLLERFTEPNQIVLEPFAGSGTVGVACMQMRRRCILIDNDIESVKITKARLRETWKGMK